MGVAKCRLLLSLIVLCRTGVLSEGASAGVTLGLSVVPASALTDGLAAAGRTTAAGISYANLSFFFFSNAEEASDSLEGTCPAWIA